jgi:S1-C subfamily serine protease
MDDRAIVDPQEFNYRLATHPLGVEAQLSVIRDGTSVTLPLVMASAGAYERQGVTIRGDTRFAGTTGAELTPAFADEFGLPYDAQGIVISAVEAGSPADQMGLRRGDIILNLQGRDVRTTGDFEKLTSGRPRAWQIVLQRDGRVIRSIVEG